MLRIGGQSLYEMSETQLRKLLPDYTKGNTVYNEILRVLAIKAKIRASDIRSRYQADEDFTRNNF